MDTRELAYADWKAGMKYKDIAEKHGVSLSAVKSWAARYWKLREVATTGEKKSQPKNKRLQPKRQTQPTPDSVDKRIADAVEENEELTERQKDFCVYFMRNRNATQAYLKAYGCAYATASTNGPALLRNTRVQEELRRLREIKNAALGGLCGEDVVELHMRIAFADMTDYVEFGSYTRPVMRNGSPVMIERPGTEEKAVLTKTVNEVHLMDSSTIDGQLIMEISEGRDGAKVKLADRQKSLAFLERYFELNPMDRHRKEYDDKRLALEQKRMDSGADSDNEPVVICGSDLLDE